ncbi:MAG: arginine--tRNA ligase [Hyphomicrobiaceae bacterium]|nr:arginine--tRNA ligase [Hyphomicrobiaceae bacterium]
MNVFNEIGAKIRSALEQLQSDSRLPAGLDLSGIEVQEPRDPQHGDLASNAAMVLAKPARMKPRDIADLLAPVLSTDPDIASVEVAGPGFLNLRLADAYWHGVVRKVLADGERFGRGGLGDGRKVHIEYVSANPTGPMHIGHCRGAVFGDTLANVLAAAGFDVTREYYINDAGAQVDKLGQTALLRYREALGEDIGEIPPGLYPGDYLKPIGAALAETYGTTLRDKPEAEAVPIARQAAIDAMLAEIRDDLGALNVHHDIFFSERSLTSDGEDQVAAAIEALRAKGLIYEGRLPRPKGHDEDEWEDREQTLFRSTAFGDDMDRALKKSDGSYTYFAGDVAYHYNKLRRGFDSYFNVLGADHVGYIPRLKAAVQALGGNHVDFHTPVTQLVKVLRDGQPVRMSKRAGTFVALRDVVDEVGCDPVRFMMLMRKHDSALDFDLAKVVEQSKDNPVFYVKYAHARAASVFRGVTEANPELAEGSPAIVGADLSLLTDEGERSLIRELARFPRVIEGAARDHEPHRVPFYLYDLASAFHQQWARGNDSPQLRFSQIDDLKLTAARLALVAAVKQVIRTGLAVLGIHAPDEMR